MKLARNFHMFVKDVASFAGSSGRSRIVTIQTIVCLLLCLLSLLTFLFLTDQLLENELTNIDVPVSQLVYASRTLAMTELMMLITSMGSWWTISVVSLACVTLLIKNHRKEAVLFCITLLIGVFLNTGLKRAIQRERPTVDPLIIETTFSFPSSHAMNSFIFFSLFTYFSFHFFRKRNVTILVMSVSIIAILIIGYSRIYLGAHYFTDVIAGYVAGFWWFITMLLIDRGLIFYKLFKKTD